MFTSIIQNISSTRLCRRERMTSSHRHGIWPQSLPAISRNPFCRGPPAGLRTSGRIEESLVERNETPFLVLQPRQIRDVVQHRTQTGLGVQRCLFAAITLGVQCRDAERGNREQQVIQPDKLNRESPRAPCNSSNANSPSIELRKINSSALLTQRRLKLSDIQISKGSSNPNCGNRFGKSVIRIRQAASNNAPPSRPALYIRTRPLHRLAVIPRQNRRGEQRNPQTSPIHQYCTVCR